MEDFWMEHRYSSCCYQLEPHYEHTYQLVFLLKGKILYQVGEKQYEVSKGGMILLNSLEEHTLKVLEYPYERYISNPSFCYRGEYERYNQQYADYKSPKHVYKFLPHDVF